jgi:foldase protein PrsA
VKTPVPRRVPPGAIAIVGAAPITGASFHHWVAIVSRRPSGTEAPARREALQRTVSFLIKAQWLVQEATNERINESVVDKIAARQIADGQQSAQSGMTPSDALFQSRLDVIAEALQTRHSSVPAPVSAAEIARYYATHRSEFVNPGERDTLMVVTRDRAAALQARAALMSGSPWRAVAKRWSLDSSALNGGAYAVVMGVQSPTLVHAVFDTPLGRLTGPVRAVPETQPAVVDYYLFKVTGEHRSSPRRLAQVATEVRDTLVKEDRQRGLAAFIRDYERRWRSRTLCAPGYVVLECRNDTAHRRGTMREHG